MPARSPSQKPGLPHHLMTGAQGEELASRLLAGAGLDVLDRNWRHGRLELDIVCKSGDLIVFVEVKTRTSSRCGGPLGAINSTKRDRLIKAASFWLSEHDAWHSPCRFDVVCIVRDDTSGSFSVEHIPDAFDSSQALCGRHSSWQPW